MNIQLTSEQERLIESRLKAGLNVSAADVIDQALVLLDRALDELDRGEGIDGETFMQGLLDELDAREVERRPG